MKKVKRFLIVVPLFIVFSVVALSGCFFTNEKDAALYLINSHYSIEIPSTVELIYNVKNTGFTDGTYYYVLETTDEQNSISDDGNAIEYTAVTNDTVEKYERIISFIGDDFNEEYAVNWEHNLVYYYKLDDATPYSSDFILLIYDSEFSYLYVMETV